MDLLLNTDHDCEFENGSVLVTSDRVDVVVQRLKIRLLTFLGEWRYNTLYGVPYYQRILGIKNSKQDVDTLFQIEILKEPGVKRIISFDSQLSNRQYTLNFRVQVTSGQTSDIIEISPGA